MNPALSQTAELVILRAMAKEPADRYQTAGEMATALEQAVETEAGSVQAIHLAQIAEEIAATKGVENVTPEIRRALQRQDQAASRKNLLLVMPWIAVACLVAGLASTLLFTLNTNLGSRTAAGQTATAVMLLLNELNSAQTAIAAGGPGSEATVQYLQTRLADIPAAESVPGGGTPAAPEKTATPRPVHTLAASSTPKPNTPVATNTLSSANTPTASRPTLVKTPPPTQRLPLPTKLPTALPTLPVKLPE